MVQKQFHCLRNHFSAVLQLILRLEVLSENYQWYMICIPKWQNKRDTMYNHPNLIQNQAPNKKEPFFNLRWTILRSEVMCILMKWLFFALSGGVPGPKHNGISYISQSVFPQSYTKELILNKIWRVLTLYPFYCGILGIHIIYQWVWSPALLLTSQKNSNFLIILLTLKWAVRRSKEDSKMVS